MKLKIALLTLSAALATAFFLTIGYYIYVIFNDIIDNSANASMLVEKHSEE